MNVHSRNPCDAGAAEDTVDGDAAKRMLRSVVREAPSDVLVSVLAEELTDAQLEELIAKRRKGRQREQVDTVEGPTVTREDDGSAPECIKQERVVASRDIEVLEVGPQPEDGNIASDEDNDEEGMRPRRGNKRRNSRIGDSDESEREADPDQDQGEGSDDSDQEPLNRTTQSLPALTQSVRKLRRRSTRLQEPEVSMSEESDESDLSSSNREPLRRTRSATHSLPSDSPSTRTLALRRLREARAKRQLTYGEGDGGRGGKTARFESSSDSGTDDDDAESSDDADDLPDLPSEDELSWDCEEGDGDTDVEMDDNDIDEETDDSADSEESSGDERSGSSSDDFDTIIGNLRRSTRKYKEATERYHEARIKKSPSGKSKAKGREEEEEKVVVHERLMRRLRKKASRPGLSDAEIVDEMALYATGRDDGCGGKCLCGKKGLKFLYFMHNKNVADPVKRTLGHKFIVGSECINAFRRGPLGLFDNLFRKGVAAFFRRETDASGDSVFTITGKSGRYIAEERERIAESYRMPVTIAKRRNGESGKETTVVNVLVRKSEQRLERDKKYRIFLRPRFSRPRDRGPYTVTFDLERAEEPADTVSSKDRPPSAKDFLK